MAKSICREYNVNYDYLIYEEGEMFSDLPQTILDELCAQYSLNDFDKAIIELYVNTPLELRQEVKKMMKEFIQKVNWEE